MNRQKIMDSIPKQVKPKILNLVSIASPLEISMLNQCLIFNVNSWS